MCFVFQLPFLVSVFPHALSMSISENLEPKRQFLVDQGLSRQQVTSVLQRAPQFMSIALERLELKVALLRQRGLSRDDVTRLLSSTPEVLGLSPETVDAKLNALDALFGSRALTMQAWSTNWRLIMCKSQQLTRAYVFLTTEVAMPHDRIMCNVKMLTRNVDRILRPRYAFLLATGAMTAEELADKTVWIFLPDELICAKFHGYEPPSRMAVDAASKSKPVMTTTTLV